MSATDQNEDRLDFLQGIEPETPEQEQPAETALSPIDLLLALSWQAIADAPNLDALSAGPALAAIIRVPSDAWIDPVHHFVHESNCSIMIVDGSTKRRDWSAQEALIIDALDRGKTVFGIASDPDAQLPPLLRAAADVFITVPAPTPDLMRKAIRHHTGSSRVPSLTAADIGGLDLLDFAAALRPQTTPKACIKRLKAASAARSVDTSDDSTPPLQELCGYGAARDWALEMLAEVELMRAGHKPALESGLFFGPPGTGKTTIARSMAKSARLPFFSTSIAAWFQHREGHLGDVLQQASEIFTRARNSAPSILFIDEIEALPSRSSLSSKGGGMSSSSASWWTPLVTQVLLHVDACRADPRGVILLAATNHIDRVDPALLRPGRFDRHFRIDPPDAAGLAGILKAHLGSDCPDLDRHELARLMPGRTGADVAALVREARRKARHAGRALGEADLLAAILPPDPRPLAERHHVALHEAGHAVVAHLLGYAVETVTIRGEGNAGGWTDVRLPAVSDRSLIEARVKILLAGRAANTSFGATADTGATADLAEATRLLAAARVSFGMTDSLVYRAGPDQALDMVARDRALADAIGHDLTRLMISTKCIVAQNRSVIARVADALLERSVLDGAELTALMVSTQKPARRREPRLDRPLLRH